VAWNRLGSVGRRNILAGGSDSFPHYGLEVCHGSRGTISRLAEVFRQGLFLGMEGARFTSTRTGSSEGDAFSLRETHEV